MMRGCQHDRELPERVVAGGRNPQFGDRRRHSYLWTGI